MGCTLPRHRWEGAVPLVWWTMLLGWRRNHHGNSRSGPRARCRQCFQRSARCPSQPPPLSLALFIFPVSAPRGLRLSSSRTSCSASVSFCLPASFSVGLAVKLPRPPLLRTAPHTPPHLSSCRIAGGQSPFAYLQRMRGGNKVGQGLCATQPGRIQVLKIVSRRGNSPF